jgi:hypothetical protein
MLWLLFLLLAEGVAGRVDLPAKVGGEDRRAKAREETPPKDGAMQESASGGLAVPQPVFH